MNTPILKPDGSSSGWIILPEDVSFAITVKVTHALDLPVEITDCARRVTGVSGFRHEPDGSLAG